MVQTTALLDLGAGVGSTTRAGAFNIHYYYYSLATFWFAGSRGGVFWRYGRFRPSFCTFGVSDLQRATATG